MGAAAYDPARGVLGENEEEATVASLRADLDAYLNSTIDIAEKLAKSKPSRSLSLAKTKLEEAEMWLARLDDDAVELW